MKLPADHHLIGLCGRAGTGKDTVADRLVEQHQFSRYAFADPLRSMLEVMLIEAGLEYAYIHERSLKEQPIPGLGFSYRHLAQTLGTEWGRSLSPTFWLQLAALNLGLHDLPNSAPVHDRIVITDVRFPNEATWLRALGGQVVLIQRDVPNVRHHESELHVGGTIQCDLVLDNTGSLAGLYDRVDLLAAQLLAKGDR